MVYTSDVAHLLVDATDLHKNHLILLGRQPTPLQENLYQGFPKYRGYLDLALNEEAFEAVSVTALVQTFTKKTQPEPFRVFLLVPSLHEDWAIAQLQGFAKTLFGRMKDQKAKGAAEAIGRAFKALWIGSRILQMKEEPTHWAAFGFSESDVIPPWLQSGLMKAEVPQISPGT